VDIRPIKTRADHREALKEIERLLGAKPGTSDGDRLEVLTTLVEHYEAEHEPVDPNTTNSKRAGGRGGSDKRGDQYGYIRT
jgi:antitoxin component HigA of HigAB toxin-antitoxin module